MERCGHYEQVKVGGGRWKCIACGQNLTIPESIQNSVELSEVMRSAIESQKPLSESLDDLIGRKAWAEIRSRIPTTKKRSKRGRRSMIDMIIGVSSTRTRYKIRTPSGEHYVRCGADLLLNGIKGDLEAESHCPVCESIVQFQIADKRLLHLRPDTSILHVVQISMANGRTGIECEGSPIFDKENCLRAWLARYHGRPGLIIKPQAFLDRMMTLRASNPGQMLTGYS